MNEARPGGLHAAIAAAQAKNARIDSHIVAFNAQQDRAWVKDHELDTLPGLVKQGAAKLLERVPEVLSRGSTWQLDSSAAKRGATLDPQAQTIARQASPYENEQSLIKDYRANVLKASMSAPEEPVS